jgi:hypothetical protein
MVIAAESCLAQSANPPPAPQTAPSAQEAASPQVAAALAGTIPKYNPPTPQKLSAEEAEFAALEARDKPKNKIIRLPKVVVQGVRPPIFAEHELYTPSGLTDLALKRYVTDVNGMPSATAAALTRFLFGSYAQQQYQAAQRQQEMSDTEDTAKMFQRAGDSGESAALNQAVQDSYLLRGDFGGSAEPSDPAYVPATGRSTTP